MSRRLLDRLPRMWLVLVAAPFLIAGNCDGGGSNSDGGSGPQGSSVGLRLVVDQTEMFANGEYNQQVTWAGSVVKPGEGSGEDTLNSQKNYSGQNDHNGVRILTVNVPKLQPGVWKLSVVTDLEAFAAECEVTLDKGPNIVTFRQNQPGCNEGPG